MTGKIHKRITYLGLAIEQGTEDVPGDGRFHVTDDGKVLHSCSSLNIAEAYLELAEEEKRAANPHLKNPRDILVKEQGFNDILSVRGASRAAARAKQDQKGGKGGRGGV